MSRENFDIPEVFRRAMEEAGWDTGREQKDPNGGNGGDDDRGGRKPFPRRPNQPRRPNRTIWLVGIFFVILLSLNWIVTTFTEWLWFADMGYQQVWLKQWGVQVLSFVIFFLLGGAILLINWQIARRRAVRSTPSHYPQFLQFPGLAWLINGLALFFAFIFASAAASQWERFLLYFYQAPYGTTDPIFGQDISFYLFTFPVLSFLQSWFSSLLFIVLLGLLAIYLINYLPDIQRGRWKTALTGQIRQHVALIGVLFFLLWAADHGLSIYGLLFSDQGVIYGAAYTDMNANIYGLWAQLGLMIGLALAVGLNLFRVNFRLPLIVGGLWLAAGFLLGSIYPSLLQNYDVKPNEIVRETPYIEHNIRFTRMAFGLDKVENRPFAYGGNLTQQDLEENEVIFRNVRLWDYRPLRATYSQLQALRPYYDFAEIDIDRYTFDGELRQVMLAARELNKARLPNPTWVNENLEFTHGFGIVMNPVDQVSRDGQPVFFVKDLPPVSEVPLQIDRPEIYYGELTTDVVFVGSDREEFSYPSGDENVYSSYQGTGGVLLDNFLKRLAFAIRLGDVNVMLSDEITTETRVKIHRQILQRVQQITPFLAFDADPYIVAWNGRLVWMLDGYTLSNRFPYSTPLDTRFGRINYMRSAVKVTVDAYDGDVTYYLIGEDDPIILAYAQAFPNLFKPMADMPQSLQAHLRYPEDLFTVQTQQYLTYHMQNVRVFYNREDLRAFPNEISDGKQARMEPYYVILPLPGEDSGPEFLLIQPFTPANKTNMVTWIAARNDPPNYGQLIEYEMPKQELVFGPIQIEGRIDQEPEISQQLTLWNQQGSRVIRGNLIVIPVNNSFLYIEPIYLQSETSALPELKRVIAATNTHIVMRETLEQALQALILDAPAVDVIVLEPDAPLNVGDGGEGTAVNAPPTPITVNLDAGMSELIQAANRHFQAAEAAQRRGDWATYGAELQALEQNLQRLQELIVEPEP